MGHEEIPSILRHRLYLSNYICYGMVHFILNVVTVDASEAMFSHIRDWKYFRFDILIKQYRVIKLDIK